MSKVEQYIKDAVAAAADQLKAKGCEISHVNIDSGTTVNVDNGDATDVLLELAKAQSAMAGTQAIIAQAVVSITKTQPTVNNNSTGLSFKGVDERPMAFHRTEDE